VFNDYDLWQRLRNSASGEASPIGAGLKPLDSQGVQASSCPEHHIKTNSSGKFASLPLTCGIVVGFVVFLALLFARAMAVGLNHDEQQFIAAGKLFSTHGLLPYRDYPFFHTPLLVLIYGWLFRWADHLLLAARSASVLWTWLGLVAVFLVGLSAQAQPPHRRLLLAFTPVFLLFVNPVFTYTYGKAWNQALPAMLVVLAIACHSRGARSERVSWFGVSGLLVALAVSARISFAPLALPFLLMAWFIPSPDRRSKVHAAIAFCVGIALGFIPAAIIVLRDPVAFLFDNFAYNGAINSAYRGPGSSFWPATGNKIRFFFKLLGQPANLFFIGSFLFLLWPRRERMTYLRRLVLAVMAFACLGAFAATPSYPQYYYPVFTLGALAMAIALAEIGVETFRFRWGIRLVQISVLVGAFTAVSDYQGITGLFAPATWIPVRNHDEGIVLRGIAPPGPILALAPLVPLEGGLDIYPSFANGPFAWRTADFLTPAQRTRYGFVGDDELAALLAAQPPGGIFVGREKELDPPMITYAKEHNYRRIDAAGGKVLWVPPRR